MIWFLLIQSLLLPRSYHDEQPPDTRALRAIVIASSTPNAEPGEAERAKAERALAELTAGVPFESVVQRYSSGSSVKFDGVLGTFTPGVLAPEVDRFLFSAPIGATSRALKTPLGLQIVERIERDAACAMIQIDLTHTDGKELATSLRAELDAGADFADLARRRSDDRASGERGGLYRIFERSAQDQLLKKAVFDLPIGGIAGPIESPVGWHIVKRLPVEDFPESLREPNFVRVRAITVAWGRARGASPDLKRDQDDARQLADDLRRRVVNGEDMEALARLYDDDPIGRARGGDLGWLRRRSPIVPVWLDVVFFTPIGEPTEVLGSDFGWVIARRER